MQVTIGGKRWYFNPRSPQGERRQSTHTYGDIFVISIHAPRKGSDVALYLRGGDVVLISIHAPRKGSDKFTEVFAGSTIISIHAPRKGSDINSGGFKRSGTNFNPRSPQGERPLSCLPVVCRLPDFNPRSPQGERPYVHSAIIDNVKNFNPRSPQGERRNGGLDAK